MTSGQTSCGLRGLAGAGVACRRSVCAGRSQGSGHGLSLTLIFFSRSSRARTIVHACYLTCTHGVAWLLFNCTATASQGPAPQVGRLPQPTALASAASLAKLLAIDELCQARLKAARIQLQLPAIQALGSFLGIALVFTVLKVSEALPWSYWATCAQGAHALLSTGSPCSH